jgi:hypothetical protein
MGIFMFLRENPKILPIGVQTKEISKFPLLGNILHLHSSRPNAESKNLEITLWAKKKQPP